MGRFISIITITGLVALTMLWFPAHDPNKKFAAVTDIATITNDNAKSSNWTHARRFSPEHPLVAHHTSGARNEKAPAAVARAAIVADAREQSIDITARAQDPSRHGRASRARKLQKALRQAGCYTGDIDGDWGPGSRRAMQTFITSINASLPVDEPDEVLLSLVTRNSNKGCAAGCPPGFELTAHGRCALRHRPSEQQGLTAWNAETRPVIEQAAATGSVPRDPLPGRMSIGARPGGEHAFTPDTVPGTVIANQVPGAPGNPAVIVYGGALDETANAPLIQSGPTPRVEKPAKRRQYRRKSRDVFRRSWAQRAFRSD